MEQPLHLDLDDFQLERVDSDSPFSTSSSASTFPLVLRSEYSRSTSGSGDISTVSSGSGDIPVVAISEALPSSPSLDPPPSEEMSAKRDKCVGRNNKGISWGFTSVIGRRKEMEDAIAVIPGFMSLPCDHVGGCTAPCSKSSSEISPVHFFGVFDGHGGSQIKRWNEMIA